MAGRIGQEAFLPFGITSGGGDAIEHHLSGTGIEPMDRYAMVEGSQAGRSRRNFNTDIGYCIVTLQDLFSEAVHSLSIHLEARFDCFSSPDFLSRYLRDH